MEVYFQNEVARVIHSDLGATNGIIHFVDNVLATRDDLTRDVSSSSQLRGSLLLLMCTTFFLHYCRMWTSFREIVTSFLQELCNKTYGWLLSLNQVNIFFNIFILILSNIYNTYIFIYNMQNTDNIYKSLSFYVFFY